MTYLDKRFKRTRDPLYLNDFEVQDGIQAATIYGIEWGELKRELINQGVRRMLKEKGLQVTSEPYAI